MHSKSTPSTPTEHKVIELRESGLSIKKIMEMTGLPERRVKELSKSVEKPKKAPKISTKSATPSTKSIERAFTLASSNNVIRDYEFRSILHEEYGSSWDTSKGSYTSNYNSSTIKWIKSQVQERATEIGTSVVFVMDWIDEKSPRSGFNFLCSAANDLLSRMAEYVTEYMAVHGTRAGDDSESAVLARRKQRYAATQYLLKLTVPGYGPEPLEKLMDRSVRQIGELEGCPDIPISKSVHEKLKTDEKDYFPEPSRQDHFLDYAEAQGWI